MEKLAFRIFFIIIVWFSAIMFVFPWNNYGIDIPFSWENYKLGLDLQWWVELDYKVDLSEVRTEEDYSPTREKNIIDWLKLIIEKRINTLKINDSVLTSANYAWEVHIIVQIPLKWEDKEQDEINMKRAKEAIWKVVKIEFKERNNLYTWSWSVEEEWIRALDSQWRYLNDRYFVKSSVQFNEAFVPMVELTFNDEWAQIFWELSTRLVNQQMAIFVWGELLTAPNINEPILTWKAVITWNYDTKEAQSLANNINTWVVPAPIYLTSERVIDSKLWANSLERLITSWLTWFFLILIFLLYIYRLSWLVASISLVLYVVIILAIIKFLWITLTLASIAWLILSIGMAIDANILIFERIRDELRQWTRIVNSARIWFEKSWSAIWDSNVTWLIIALILFIFWVNMIKWFWLMLAIWIIVSLFSAMWISRVLVYALSKKEWINSKNFIGK